MRSTVIAILLLCIFSAASAQTYKFGKVSKSELQEKSNPQYPEATATVLYREHQTYYEYKQGVGFTLYTEVFERVKIYNQEGFEWATKSINTYNSGSDREEITSVKGTTYNLENGSVDKTKFSSRDLYEEQVSDYRTVSKFTMPNIKPGSVIEYEYKIASPFYSIDDIDLQYTIPIRKQLVEVRFPEYFIYQNYSNPQSGISYQFNKDSKDVEINLRGRSGLGTLERHNKDSSTKEDRTVTYKENIHTLDESNIPPLAEEEMVDNLDNYKAKAIWELAMVNWPGENPRSYSTTWEAVTRSIYENDAFVNQLNRKNYYEADLATALSGIDDPLKKMAVIFNLVKSKVTWDRYLSYYPSKGVKKAYEEGTGNCADINLMLVSMLRSVNLQANPVLVSTKSNGIPLFPTRHGFNYVIASVEFNGKLYLLDATDPFSDINLLPKRTMNWEGRLIRPDGTSASVGLYPGFVSKKMIYVQAEIVGENVEAVVRERFTGHYAKNYRSTYSGSGVEELKKAENANGYDLEISEYQPKDHDNLKPNMSLSFKASSGSLVEKIDNNLYLSPMLFMGHYKHPFSSEERNYPIFFEYPKSEKYTVNIKVPEGYQVTSIPEGAQANLANGLGKYTYLLQQVNPEMLQLSVTLDLNSPIVVPADYEYVRAFFDQIAEKEKEKVVLTKI